MPARAAPQRNLPNRHALCVSGSDSYALLFLFRAVYYRVTERTVLDPTLSLTFSLCRSIITTMRPVPFIIGVSFYRAMRGIMAMP